jgi:GGDEF domain-containing protein
MGGAMTEQVQVALVGGSESLRQDLERAIGVPVAGKLPASLGPGDVVFLSPAAGHGLPASNAFSACRILKRDARVRVFFLLEAADAVAEEIARFCMADGCFRLDDRGLLADPTAIRERHRPSRHGPPLDARLARLEREISDDDRRRSGALQRMLDDQDERELLAHITDPETGLFDGRFAAFKLDEEFKRASRFHQPLTLILLHCGIESWPSVRSERQTLLAEIAAVFLNECRDIDIIARFTEEVFLFLLPGTGADGAQTMARRILDELRARAFAGGARPRPTAGLVTVPATGVHDRKGFLARAEACLEIARLDEVRAGLCAL